MSPSPKCRHGWGHRWCIECGHFIKRRDQTCIARTSRRDPYAADIPSRAMARWLCRADASKLLPNLDREGHAISVRIIRACHYRGWVRRRGPRDFIPENDASVLWFVTGKGEAALRRAEAAHGEPLKIQ